jgi:hypothetical protein
MFTENDGRAALRRRLVFISCVPAALEAVARSARWRAQCNVWLLVL